MSQFVDDWLPAPINDYPQLNCFGRFRNKKSNFKRAVKGWVSLISMSTQGPLRNR